MGKLGIALNPTTGDCFANFVGDNLYNNNIFDLTSSGNRDECFAPYFQLRNKFSSHGIQLNTKDINKETNLIFELHMDVQKVVNRNIPHYVILCESPKIKPINEQKSLLAKYKRVFTWRDDWVDGERYIKINLPNQLVVDNSRGWSGRDKLCCMISGNRTAPHASPYLLYAERIKSIVWFERNAPNEFDLFGIGWDEPAAIHGLFGRAIAKLRLHLPKRAGQIYFQSYRGKVVSKLATFKNYRFSICYENVRDIPGYITEKIFDSFFAGCIPVYWGAANVTHYIPEDCFIDRRKFESHEALYNFMVSMTESEFVAYQERISSFLTSDSAKLFSVDFFAETIVNTIVTDLEIST